MNESISISDAQSSTKSLALSREEMEEKVSSLPEETIVNCASEMFRPYILLKDIDDKPYWRPYGGEKLEDLRRYHKWELDAQRHLKEKARSQEEVDYFRNAMLAVALVADLLDMNGDDGKELMEMIDSAAYAISLRWYCKDKGIDRKTFDPMTNPDEELPVYYQMAVFYATSFANTMRCVRENVEVASGSTKS